MVTTCLYGTVLALKNGVPVIDINPGGEEGKIRRQTEAIVWPVVFGVSDLTEEALQRAFDYCLTEHARAKARECFQQALKIAREVSDRFISTLDCSDELQSRKSIHSRRWSQDQWQGTLGQNFDDISLAAGLQTSGWQLR